MGNYFLIIAFCFIVVSTLFFAFKSIIFNFLEIKHFYAFWVILAGLILHISKEFVFEVLKVIRLIKLQTFLFRLATKLFVVVGVLFLAFILFNINVNYVIAVFLFSDLLVVVIGFVFIKRSYLFPFQINREMAKTMIIYAFPLLFASWANYVINWVDAYVIKYYMTLADVGIYQAAYKITSTLKSFWGASLVTITTPIIMVYKTEGQINKITGLYLKRLLPQLSFFTMIVVSLIILFADIFFNHVYGVKFAASILPFKIICASISFTAITYSLMAVITSFDMTKLMLWIGLITGILNVVADFLLVPIFGIVGPAIASCTIFSIGPLIWFFFVNRKFRFDRNLSILFPIVTLVILLINISPWFYFIKLILSFCILCLAYLIGRRFDLFLLEDTRMLTNINMPESIRHLLTKIIKILGKDNVER